MSESYQTMGHKEREERRITRLLQNPIVAAEIEQILETLVKGKRSFAAMPTLEDAIEVWENKQFLSAREEQAAPARHEAAADAVAVQHKQVVKKKQRITRLLQNPIVAAEIEQILETLVKGKRRFAAMPTLEDAIEVWEDKPLLSAEEERAAQHKQMAEEDKLAAKKQQQEQRRHEELQAKAQAVLEQKRRQTRPQTARYFPRKSGRSSRLRRRRKPFKKVSFIKKWKRDLKKQDKRIKPGRSDIVMEDRKLRKTKTRRKRKRSPFSKKGGKRTRRHRVKTLRKPRKINKRRKPRKINKCRK